MADINSLMLKREHFPISVEDGQIEVIMPPYHPLMAVRGISPRLGRFVLDEAVAETLKDLKQAAEKLPEIADFLENLPKDEQGNPDIYDYDEKGTIIYPDFVRVAPFHLGPEDKDLVITTEGIYFGGSEGKSYCRLRKPNEKKHTGILNPGTKIDFSKEVIKEYGWFEISRGEDTQSTLESKYRWDIPEYEHGIRKVFYKNFSIAYCNEIVRRKKSLEREMAMPWQAEKPEK